MKWIRGEACYLAAWACIGCGIVLKHLRFGPEAIACFDKGIHYATRATTLYGAKP